MRILLHGCCGPCSVYPLEKLREQKHEVHGFFYNPNIHPYTEYKRRLDTFRQFAAEIGLEVTVKDDYDLETFLRTMSHREDVRCGLCYQMRLNETARRAKEEGFDAFSSTLLVSPYQKHELIREMGAAAADKYQIRFHYDDFRPGYRDGVAKSKQMQLYRQPYCGCIYSERDRYQRKG